MGKKNQENSKKKLDRMLDGDAVDQALNDSVSDKEYQDILNSIPESKTAKAFSSKVKATVEKKK